MSEADSRRSSRVPEAISSAVSQALLRLLAAHGFSELTVDDLLAESGVKKTTFYTHYPSMEAVLEALLRDTILGLRGRVAVEFARAADLEEGLQSMIGLLLDLYLAHGTVLRTASEEWASIPAVGRIWLASAQALSDEVAREIEELRSQGRAPDNSAAQALASTLVWTGERTAYMHATGQIAPLRERAAAVDALTAVVLGAILAPPLPRRASPDEDGAGEDAGGVADVEAV